MNKINSIISATSAIVAMLVLVACGDKGGTGTVTCEPGTQCDCTDSSDCPSGEACSPQLLLCIPVDMGDVSDTSDTSGPDVRDSGPADTADVDVADTEVDAAPEPDVAREDTDTQEVDVLPPDVGTEDVEEDVTVQPRAIVNPWVAFTRRISGLNQVVVQRLDGTGVLPLLREDTVSEAPAWSPDGTQLVMIAFQLGGDRQLRLVDFEAGTDEFIDISSLQTFVNPAFSPDGESLIMSGRPDRDTPYQLWRYELATGAIAAITPDDSNADYPLWLPTGRIYYASDETGSFELHRVNADGSESELVLARTDVVGGFAVAIDASRYAWVRSTSGTTSELVFYDVASEDEVTVSGSGLGSPSFAVDAVAVSHNRQVDGSIDVILTSAITGEELRVVSGGPDIDSNAQLAPVESETVSLNYGL
jgi:dipeptidyl aminopeptidase/acylaminoacyl peptidase